MKEVNNKNNKLNRQSLIEMRFTNAQPVLPRQSECINLLNELKFSDISATIYYLNVVCF